MKFWVDAQLPPALAAVGAARHSNGGSMGGDVQWYGFRVIRVLIGE